MEGWDDITGHEFNVRTSDGEEGMTGVEVYVRPIAGITDGTYRKIEKI